MRSAVSLGRRAEVGAARGDDRALRCRLEWLDTFFNLDLGGNDVLYMSERINDLGIECSHFADGAGLAFEAWEKGLLGPDRTDGLELQWGDVGTIDRLLEMCARREGWLGNLLADGPKELAAALGGDAAKWVVHTKGGTPAQHEWRPLLGNMLRELVASGGMKPQGGGSNQPPPDLRYRETWGPLDAKKPDGWAWSHLLSEQYRQAAGLMGACWFAQNQMVPDGLQSMYDALSATTAGTSRLTRRSTPATAACSCRASSGRSAAGSPSMTGPTLAHASSSGSRMASTQASRSPTSCRG
jgi:aldehyde:ferredoxin oxidoreductase